MLWLITEESSQQIVSCNMSKQHGKFQVWVERINGKGLKVYESQDEKDVKTVRDAIDYAIKTGEKSLDMRSTK